MQAWRQSWIAWESIEEFKDAETFSAMHLPCELSLPSKEKIKIFFQM